MGGGVIGFSKGKQTTAHDSVASKPLTFGLNKDVSGSDVNELIWKGKSNNLSKGKHIRGLVARKCCNCENIEFSTKERGWSPTQKQSPLVPAVAGPCWSRTEHL